MDHDVRMDGIAEAASARRPVVELRRYTLHPGTRETLIALFEREFVESQEAVGMRVTGQFRDIDDPDAFVWLRAFDDVGTRAASLAAFYDGPVWSAHRDAANATMIAWDDVHLLHPIRWPAELATGDGMRASPGATAVPTGLIVATIYLLRAERAADFTRLFSEVVEPVLCATGAAPLATLETEASANDFPRLPVREHEHAFVWLARFASRDAYARHLTELATSPEWRTRVRPALQSCLAAPVQVRRLEATARSRLRP